jgi:hypothetical protein
MSYIRLKIFFNKNNKITSTFWDVKAISPRWEILRRRSSRFFQDVKAGFLIVRNQRAPQAARRPLVSSAVVFAEVEGP